MKKLTLQSVAAMLVAVLITFSSCSKEGPEGPQGPVGPAGPPGTTGPGGAPGPAGTANVIYSEWLSNDFEEIVDEEDEVVGYGLSIPAPKLTADVINTGEMKVYVNVGSAAEPVVFPLPYNDGGVYIDVIFGIGEIYISSNMDLSGFPFRYVLIPGGTAARKSGNSVDWNDYNSVKKYLNLKD